MIYKKNEELKIEDIPNSVDREEDLEKIKTLRSSFDLSSVKSKMPIRVAHKNFLRFLRGEDLSLTELRIALWGVLDLNRWTVFDENDEKKHKEQESKLVEAIKEKIKNKEFN